MLKNYHSIDCLVPTLKKNLFVFLIILNIGLVQCNSEKKEEHKISQIDLPNFGKKSEVKLSELNVKDIQYIPLETNTHCLLPQISTIGKGLSKIIANEKGFFINDYRNNRILRFDTTGKFICQIGTKGKGPNEYLFTNDFSIDVKNDKVVILSILQDKLFLYSLEGEFLRTIKCSESVTHVMCVDGNVLCYNRNTGSIENSFELIDYSGTILKSYPNKYKFQAGAIVFVEQENECMFYWYNDNLNIKERYSDTIFTFKDRSFIPKMVVNRGERRFIADLLIYNTEDELTRVIKEKLPLYIDEECIYEFGNYIYSQFWYKDDDHAYIISKNGEGEFLRFFDNGIINDIDGGPNVTLNAMKDDKTLIDWIDPIDLKSYINSDKFENSYALNPDKKIQLSKLVNNLKEDDNPVMMVVRLK